MLSEEPTGLSLAHALAVNNYEVDIGTDSQLVDHGILMERW